MKLLLNGAKGRMGQAIIQAAHDAGDTLTAALDLGDDATPHLSTAEAVIDFSFHDATAPLVKLAGGSGLPVVIGTTGHTEDERKAIRACADQAAIVWAGNYSVGVNLLIHLVEQAAATLGADYHPEIIEMHHRHKKDAPSGTAEALLDAVLKARGLDQSNVTHGREGITGERPDAQVGVHALRGGDIVGDHTVLFAGPGERLELTHKAADRAIFAQGALRAARWALDQPPGLYDMRDVLGLK